MNDEIKAKARFLLEHPVMASLTTFTVLGGALTMFMNVSGIYDSAHVSEAELAETTARIDAVDLRVTEQSTKSSCENLAIRISLAETAIWQMEQQSNMTTQRLVEKRRELSDLEAKFRTLNCASILK